MKQEPKKQKLHQKLISGGVTLLLIVAVCLCLFIVVQVLSHGHASLGGYSFFKVITGSMEPELSTGDLLLVVAREEYKADEVVVFLDGRSAVVHRIISMDGDTVITQGDANNQADEPISTELICGKVVLAIPLLGYLVSVIKTPLGTLLILALAVWLLNRSFRREQKEKTEQLDMIRAEIERLKAEQAERTEQADQEKHDRE